MDNKNYKIWEIPLMKRIHLAIILTLFLVISFSFAACNNEKQPIQATKIGDLILNGDRINKVSIFEDQNGIASETLTSSSEIQELLRLLSNIPIKQLSKQDDIEFMQNGQKLLEKGLLIVDLEEEGKPSSGKFLIWKDGLIYIVDTISMDEPKRTISYLSKDKNLNIYIWLSTQVKNGGL